MHDPQYQPALEPDEYDSLGRRAEFRLVAELDKQEAANCLAEQELTIRIARLRRRLHRRPMPADISTDIVVHQRRAA